MLDLDEFIDETCDQKQRKCVTGRHYQNLFGKMSAVWCLTFILLIPTSYNAKDITDSSEYCEGNIQGSTCSETGDEKSKYANGIEIINRLDTDVELINLTQRKANEVRQFLI